MYMVDQELPVSENEEQTNQQVIVETETEKQQEPLAEEVVTSTVEEIPVVAEVSPTVEEIISSEAPNVEPNLPSTPDEVPNYSAGVPTEVAETASTEEKVENSAPVSQKKNKKREFERRRIEQLKKYEVVFEELKKLRKENATIEVNVVAKVKGGLRCSYKSLPLFLPISHFQASLQTSEEDLLAAVGKTFEVNIHEINKDEQGRFAVVLTRKKLMKAKRWAELEVNQVVEGTISSIVPFGVFVIFGGIEGLVHISRLAYSNYGDIASFYKVGQKVKATIVSINQETKKVSLSTKEFEASPYVGITAKLPVGSKVQGTVKSIINFGAYIELFPGVQGLLRNADFSWTQRVRNLAEVLTVGNTLDVFVIDVSEEKQQIALGVKQLIPNPWEEIANQFDKETTYSVTVKKAINQGYIVQFTEQIEAFIPKSKLVAETANSINVGDPLSVKIIDIDTKNNSIVLAQEGYVAPAQNTGDRQKRQDNNRDKSDRGSYKGKQSYSSNQDGDHQSSSVPTEQSSVTFFDMLDESQMKKISKLSK